MTALFAATWDRGDRHVVTIGNFDGVHRGHQFLMRRVVERANELSAIPAAITFDPLPIEVFRPDHPPHRLTTAHDRVRLIEATGIERVVTVRFSHEVAAVEPDDFVRQVVETLRPRLLVVGEDFAFGRNRAGTPALLQEMGKQDDFAVEIVQKMTNAEHPISSSRIRAELAEGDIEHANALFGRPYFMRGAVVQGNQRGRELGFPTANLRAAENLLAPGDGIYAALTQIGDAPDLVPSMVYVGRRPTFDEVEQAVEVNLIDFSGDLYGRDLAVIFVHRVRGDERFDSVDALIDQMVRDRERTREIMGSLPSSWPGEPLTWLLGVGQGAIRRDG
jgi:riboflavin kinase/FMN adenylyltransferase